LDGPIPKLYSAVALSRQDGHHSATISSKFGSLVPIEQLVPDKKIFM
jgi:hypothetical protein